LRSGSVGTGRIGRGSGFWAWLCSFVVRVDGKLELPRLGSQAGAWEPAETCVYMYRLLLMG